MTNKPLSQAEKIELIATEVMGWEKKGKWWQSEKSLFEAPCSEHSTYSHEGYDHLHLEWNPYEDWSHWRQVEEKIIEKGMLQKYFNKIFHAIDATCEHDVITADLPTRCDALISILQES